MKFRFLIALSLAALLAILAAASSFAFSTGTPDGKIATLSRVASAGNVQTETADDFLPGQQTILNQATFIGLIPAGLPLSSIGQVEIEFYHVFPRDSGPFDGLVPTRKNSPADMEIGSATRHSSAGTLSYSVTLLNSKFSAADRVVNGVHPSPNRGGGPFGQKKQYSSTTHLAGGVPFGPQIISRNLTPGQTGNPAGLSLNDFRHVIRTGHDRENPGQLLQAMPWPFFQDMTDHDLNANLRVFESFPACADPASRELQRAGPVSSGGTLCNDQEETGPQEF